MRSVAGLLPVVVVVMVAAAGCSGSDSDRTPRVSDAEAQAEYGPIVDDVASALAAAGDTSATNDGRTFSVEGKDGVCEFWSTRYELPVWFGRDVDLDDARAAVEDSLPDGWTVGGDLDVPGGYSAFDATEEATGAVLKVRAKRTTSVQVIAPVTGDCDKDGTTIPLPSPS